jgi:2',3'-cyclic-nucleotide 2'-phosphodiesterase (5'-nucleotidase family)
MLGGHSHELNQMKVQSTWVVNSGEWWKSYSRIDLDYDPETGKAIVLTAKQVWLQQANPKSDRQVAQEIARWERSLGAEFHTPLGYTASGLQQPAGVHNFIVDCWLAMDSRADIALSNYGGFRQDIPAGPITREIIVGVMPFTNSLFRLTLTGDRLLAYLPKDGSIGMAGLRWQAGKFIVAKTGQPIDPQATYRVLINDYMYNTSPVLQGADPKPERVYEDWRQPVYDWLASHPSSKDKPLDALVDLQPRITP